jgi:hypothetical protein
VSAMAFVEPCLAIALVRGAAARALSRRSAGKLSWRKAAFKEREVTEGLFFDRSDRIMTLMTGNRKVWWVELPLPMIW